LFRYDGKRRDAAVMRSRMTDRVVRSLIIHPPYLDTRPRDLRSPANAKRLATLWVPTILTRARLLRLELCGSPCNQISGKSGAAAET